ncbi:MAG: DUF2268 domain-containing putative Zn-dependent protease [Candidatus Saccharibacteria bacterium]|nr:DUF2268 domain-containing putative Zn-dependent protease [Candidatus Saccharibacteria bacterium]
MSKINLFITEVDKNLSSKKELILNAVKKAEAYVFPKLKIDWDIDLVVRNPRQKYLKTKDCVSGHTYEDSLIVLNIEDDFCEFEISEVLVHELCHAARWGKNNEWMNTLYDVLIFEGLAVKLADDFSKNNPERQFYMETITSRPDEENEKIFSLLEGQLQNSNYDYDYIFTGNNIDLPYWAGYSLGYYLIKQYLKKSDKTIEEAFADKYADIEITVFNPPSKH